MKETDQGADIHSVAAEREANRSRQTSTTSQGSQTRQAHPRTVTHGALWALLALLALAAPSRALAQRYTFRQYDSVDGLSNMTVYSLFEDHAGYLWVGTDDGLFRYDGSRFEGYNDREGLPDSTVRGIAESPQDVLWVATRNGVARQSGRRFEPVDTGVSGVMRAIAFDQRGRLYVESASGLVRGVPQGSGAYRFQLLVPGRVNALAVHGEDLWWGQDGDLWHLNADLADLGPSLGPGQNPDRNAARDGNRNGDRPERIGSPAGLPADKWSSVAEDSLGNLWVLSTSRLYERAHGESRFVNRSAGLPLGSSLLAIDADKHGRVFVSSDAGATILDGDQRTAIDAQHGFPADTVRHVMVDREGSLWMATEGGGLVRQLGRGEWLAWKREDGLLHNTVWAVRRDSSGRVWVGSNGGLNLIDAAGKVTGSWTDRNGLAGHEVYAITEDPAGAIYASTYPYGISRFNRNGKLAATYRSPSVQAAGWILALAVDKQDYLWATGSAGCFRSRLPLDAGKPAAAPVLDRVAIPGLDTGSSASFFNVVAAPDGTVWIGSSDGLARYANGQWRLFTEQDGLKPSGVQAILPGPGNGSVWVAYRDAHGLSRLDFSGANAGRLHATHYTREDGLSSDRIYALAFDRAGLLWATSDAGANVYDPRARADQTSDTKNQWRHYYREDGLVWNDTDSYALDAGPDGSVWVGTSSGLARFSPLPYPLPEGAPPIVISSVETPNNVSVASDRLVLPFDKRSLTFHFTALSYTAESRMRFRYRLLGYDEHWTRTRERSVRFEGLPAGHYVFQLIGAGANGIYSSPVEFAFTITPPWWQSWWFLTASLIVAVMMGTVLYRLRVRALMAQKARLEALVLERTSELMDSHRQLEEIAFCDMLTSLPNRRRFTQRFRTRLEMARATGERFALMLIDLDDFKLINDTCGHDAGDAVLIETAARLKEAVRETDCVARLGGDEFAILLFAAYDPQALEEICTRITSFITAGIAYEDRELTVGSSIGVAIYPDDGQDETSLYKAADLDLYKSKRNSGRAQGEYAQPSSAGQSSLAR